MDKPFYLFSWNGYEASGVEGDCEGAFASLPDAMAAGGKTEIGCVIEVRGSELWIVAEYESFPAEWEFDERKLVKWRLVYESRRPAVGAE